MLSLRLTLFIGSYIVWLKIIARYKRILMEKEEKLGLVHYEFTSQMAEELLNCAQISADLDSRMGELKKMIEK